MGMTGIGCLLSLLLPQGGAKAGQLEDLAEECEQYLWGGELGLGRHVLRGFGMPNVACLAVRAVPGEVNWAGVSLEVQEGLAC